MGQLMLHRANVHRKSGHWSDDDFDVTHESETVGRIFKASAGTPGAEPWFWSIIFHHRRPGPPAHQGYTESREAAMAAFRAAWDLEQSGGGPPDDEAQLRRHAPTRNRYVVITAAALSVVIAVWVVLQDIFRRRAKRDHHR